MSNEEGKMPPLKPLSSLKEKINVNLLDIPKKPKRIIKKPVRYKSSMKSTTEVKKTNVKLLDEPKRSKRLRKKTVRYNELSGQAEYEDDLQSDHKDDISQAIRNTPHNQKKRKKEIFSPFNKNSPKHFEKLTPKPVCSRLLKQVLSTPVLPEAEFKEREALKSVQRYCRQ